MNRLVKVGLPVPVAVGLVYGVGFGVGWVAVVVNEIDTGPSVLLAGFVFAYALLGGILLSFVPVYTTSRSRHFAWQEVAEPDGTDLSSGRAP